jgi:hypothetical protein
LERSEGILHETDADEQDAEAEEHFAPLAMVRPLADHHQEESEADGGHRVLGDLENGEEAHDPCGESRSYIRAEDDGDGLSQGQKPCIDESDDHNGHGAAALDERGDACSDEERYKAVAGEEFDDILEAIACDLAQAFRHHANAEQEESETSDELENRLVTQGPSFPQK